MHFLNLFFLIFGRGLTQVWNHWTKVEESISSKTELQHCLTGNSCIA